jgi:hypothetical protein
MRKTKNITAIVVIGLVLSLVICMQTVSASTAHYDVEGGQLVFDTTTGSIIGYLGNPTNVIIPNEIEGVSVISIGREAFRDCTSLFTITFPESVTNLGFRAFHGTPWLENYQDDFVIECNGILILYKGTNSIVTIPESVTNIGNGAFYRCSDLTKVTIPNSVASIGEHAFEYCTILISITIPDSVTSIGGGAFASCKSLTEITIPESVASIGYSVFSRCSSMAEIIISESVKNIGDGAFYSCGSLTSIRIPESVTSIGGWAFWGCRSLTSITIPESVTSIGEEAFAYCINLSSAYFIGDAPYLEHRVFDDTDENFKIYYIKGAIGFTTPAWNGYPTEIFTLNTTNKYAITNMHFTDIEGTPITSFNPEGITVVSVDVTKNFVYDGSGVLIFALYNENKALQNVSFAGIDLEKGKTQPFTDALILKQGDILKIFVWDESMNLKPLSNTLTYPNI